jgi:acyl dehydratase
MPLDLGPIGVDREPEPRSWSAADVQRYHAALDVSDVDGVLPLFAVLLAEFGGPQETLTGVDLTRVLHAEQSLTLHRALPESGAVTVTRRISAVHDKGSGALVSCAASGVLADGAPLFEVGYSLFVLGAGGFGGPRGPVTPPDDPPLADPVTLRVSTTADQALRYRETGDRNPMHADPEFAARAGFPRPILHGLATLGIAVGALISQLRGGRCADVTGVTARFTRPVYPGDELAVTAWPTPATTRFRVATPDGAPAITHAELRHP